MTNVSGIGQILKDATTFFSHTMPNLVTIIPAMDHIEQQFSQFSHSRKFLISICATILFAKKMLNHYYSLTNKSEVYWIAMGKWSSHPSGHLSF